MSKLDELNNLGQSIWFDFIRKKLLTSGELKNLVDQGVRGVTSNPSIFQQAIGQSDDYDEDFKELTAQGKSVMEIYEALAVADISAAADVLRPVYDATEGADGFVSLEVNPELADETEATIEEAIRLFKWVGKPNVMIKVPATQAGLPAIEKLIAAGVNVNVTLLFSLENYIQVAEAYVSGLEKLAADGPSVEGGLGVDRIGSVASFFVSRVDSVVDKMLAEKGREDLIGKIAIANAKSAYKAFGEIFSGTRWDALAAKGARVQRVLWASTGTKNPDFSDVLYLDTLIGPHTVNTVPPKTLDAFLDHGVVAAPLAEGMDEALAQLEEIKGLGIDLDAITTQLQEAGVKSFADAFVDLLKSVETKRSKM